VAIDRDRPTGTGLFAVLALLYGFFCFLGFVTGRPLSLGWWPVALLIGVAVTLVSGLLLGRVSAAVERHPQPPRTYRVAEAVLGSTALIAGIATMVALVVVAWRLAWFLF
jgi:hypothetical protein